MGPYAALVSMNKVLARPEDAAASTDGCSGSETHSLPTVTNDSLLVWLARLHMQPSEMLSAFFFVESWHYHKSSQNDHHKSRKTRQHKAA